MILDFEDKVNIFSKLVINENALKNMHQFRTVNNIFFNDSQITLAYVIKNKIEGKY